MNILLNIIWVVIGGLMIAIEYGMSSVVMMISIIGIPFGFHHFRLRKLALLPFGKALN